MLELASAALGEMTAGRVLVVRAGRKRPVVEQGVARNAEGDMAAACGHPVPARGNPDDQFVHKAMASGIAAARSSAIIRGPAVSAARP